MQENNERGIALLLVLWVITLLAVVCAEFSWTMRTETKVVSHFKEGEQAYYTAEAGINRAIIELMQSRKENKRKVSEREAEEEEETVTWVPGGGPYVFEFAGGTCEVSIADETNKIGINAFLKKYKKNPGPLKRLLSDKVGLEGEQRDIVADSLIDWYDADSNVTGVNGAEKDYYESLDPPYRCRNGRIPVIDDLLLVKGIDEKIFYGNAYDRQDCFAARLTREELESVLSGSLPTEESGEQFSEERDEDDEDGEIKLGLAQIFSADSSSTSFKININTATREQLMLLENMDEETAKAIMEERSRRWFSSTTDRLPQYANYAVWKKDIKVGSRLSSGQYMVRATGYTPDRRISRRISCMLRLTGNRYIISDWKAVN